MSSPFGVITVYCSPQLSLCTVPLLNIFEWNMWGRVVNHCECTHLLTLKLNEFHKLKKLDNIINHLEAG
jgi:hypothetical protein